MAKILIIEDEPGISMVLKAYLVKAGHAVELAFDGTSGLARFQEWEPALVLLDVMLPDRDGWSVLEHIREHSACAVIMLTALSDVKHRLDGLARGADDYMGKPFVGEEVVARVHAVLRRMPQLVDEGKKALYGSLKVNFASREVWLKGETVPLTPRDLALLLFLAEHPNQSFSREQLIACVWGMDYEGSDRAVDLAIKRIRQAIASWPKEQGEIFTLRGMGYQFRVRAQA